MRLPSPEVGSVIAGLFRMRKLNVLVTALCFAMLANWPAVAQSPAVVTLLKAGRLLDPRTGNVLSPAAVLIQDARIKNVGAPSRIQPDAPPPIQPIDLPTPTFPPRSIHH